MYDVIIVGGGPAGLSAALLLGRCRRKVLLCDSGQPRNRASQSMHGFLSRDGIKPDEFRRLAREDLRSYPSVELRDIEVVDATKKDGHFSVTLQDGGRATARKLLLATGVVDVLPNVPGAREYFGRGLYQCPYCDGWEHRGQKLAVYGSDESALELALELLSWSREVTVCTDGPVNLDKERKSRLDRHGISIIKSKITRLEGDERGLLSTVHFKSGRALVTNAMFFYPQQYQRSPLPEKLGCTLDEERIVECDDCAAKGVEGLFLAGNAKPGLQLAIIAAAQGTQVAHALNNSLMEEDFELPAEDSPCSSV